MKKLSKYKAIAEWMRLAGVAVLKDGDFEMVLAHTAPADEADDEDDGSSPIVFHITDEGEN